MGETVSVQKAQQRTRYGIACGGSGQATWERREREAPSYIEASIEACMSVSVVAAAARYDDGTDANVSK